MEKSLLIDLNKRLEKEYSKFIEKMKILPQEELIDRAEEIAMKLRLSENFGGLDHYDKIYLKYLLQKRNILDYLYNEWADRQFGFDEVIESRVEVILEQESKDFKNKLYEKMEYNPHYKLIEAITYSLEELDYYSFCDNMKSKYDIDSFEIEDVYDIFVSENGVKYLYDFFNEIMMDEQVPILQANHVINSKQIDIIEDKILPELDKIMNKIKVKEQER